jgi:hypothetical protein
MAKNRDKTINALRQAIAGVQKYFYKTPTLTLGGTPTKTTAVIATLQGGITAIDDAVAAATAFHTATAAQAAPLAAANALLTELLMLVKNQLGSTAAVLGDFGFAVPTRQEPTEATKAAAVAKRAATRVARGTKGKRQKASIKGTVTPATPAPAATPTPAAKV